MQSCLNMFLNEKAALIHTASLLWTFGLNSQSTWVSCDFPPQYHRGEIPFHYPLLLRWTSLFTVLPPGDGLWRGASLHGALWPVSALAGDRRSARCGSPGQRHLPGTLLSDQASLACPTNSHCDLQRGLFHCSLGECRSAKSESPHNMRSNFFSPPSLWLIVCMATRWWAAVYSWAPADGSGWRFCLHDQGHLCRQHGWEQV